MDFTVEVLDFYIIAPIEQCIGVTSHRAFVSHELSDQSDSFWSTPLTDT